MIDFFERMTLLFGDRDLSIANDREMTALIARVFDHLVSTLLKLQGHVSPSVLAVLSGIRAADLQPGLAIDPRLKEPSRSNEILVEWRGLRTEKSRRNRVVVPQKVKRFQFASMSVDFQNGQEKHQHDRGIDKGQGRFNTHVSMVCPDRIAK
jgi:hypothetical protein